ncbi:DUF2961 domain-containing protein [Alistipes sp. AF48-12]|nr:DUF2961 domain-containing protein [Alistipes sp. AF48-12]
MGRPVDAFRGFVASVRSCFDRTGQASEYGRYRRSVRSPLRRAGRTSVYVGDGLTLFNTEYAWWGEGDEKVYVDGETFPSHLGTGSEDYYGYAWGRRERITDHPFIAQPEGAGADSAGFVQNTRLRVLDGIPFRTSLRFDMELWHHLRAVVDYAPTTYWYLRPGGRSLVEPNEKEAARKVSLHREDLVSQKMEITVEAEHMAVVSKSPEDLLNYHHHGIPYRDIWSNNAQLYWHCNRPGNRLTLSFESVLDGEFDLTLMCTLRRVTEWSGSRSTVRLLFGNWISMRRNRMSFRFRSAGRLFVRESIRSHSKWSVTGNIFPPEPSDSTASFSNLDRNGPFPAVLCFRQGRPSARRRLPKEVFCVLCGAG